MAISKVFLKKLFCQVQLDGNQVKVGNAGEEMTDSTTGTVEDTHRTVQYTLERF